MRHAAAGPLAGAQSTARSCTAVLRHCAPGPASSPARAACRAKRGDAAVTPGDRVIAPTDPGSSTSSLLQQQQQWPDDATSSYRYSGAAAGSGPATRGARAGRGGMRRSSLVKVRVPPRRRRMRRHFDTPRRLHMSPADPEFGARLTSEINSVYGPRRLTKLIEDFSPHFAPSHAAAALSLLAGMVTGRQLAPGELADTYQAPALLAADALLGRVQQASLADCARAVYSLARLQLHQPQLLAAVERRSAGQLAAATPQALAGLAVGLAHWGHTPAPTWVRELCVEAFSRMAGFTAQDLANLMFALACWRASVTQPFLLRCLTAFRGHWGAPGCHAPALARFAYALTQLPPCQDLPPAWQQQQPPGAPAYLHHDDYRRRRELAEMRAAMGLRHGGGGGGAAQAEGGSADEHDQAGWGPADDSGGGRRAHQQQQRRRPAAAGTPATAAAAASYRLPSFNWLTAFLGECRRQADRFTPPELALLLWCLAALNHTPDLAFMEAWWRASAARMHAFAPASLAAAVQALGVLRPGRDVPGSLSGRWLALVLERSRGMMDAAAAAAGGPGGAAAAAAAGSSSGGGDGGGGDATIGIGDLSKLLWGLAELQVWPGRPWMQAWLAATERALPAASPADLADMAWALARLRCAPPEAWLGRLSAAVTGRLQGFGVQGLAAVIWAYARLGARPDRLWLLRFRALAAEAAAAAAAGRPAPAARQAGAGGGGDAQQLAQFVAAFLAQQNRARFASGSGRALLRGGRGPRPPPRSS